VASTNDAAWADQQLERAHDGNLTALGRAFERWKFLNPGVSAIPGRFDPLLNAWERHHEAQQFTVSKPEQERVLQRIKKQLEEVALSYDRRRASELRLARYIETDIAPLGQIEVKPGQFDNPFTLSDKLKNCRQHSTIGLKPDGGFIAIWDEKCGLSKLCPDESREEARRLSESDIPAIKAFLEKDRRHTFQFAVFTMPNVQPGGLHQAKRDMQKRFSALLKQKCMDAVAGVRVIQEDPLAADGGFNVHLNVMLLIDGLFDWKAVRAAWGYNIDFQSADSLRSKTRRKLEQKGISTDSMDDITVLVHAYNELTKYSSQTVASKSEEKTAAGRTPAPPMVEWPADRWREWWASNKGFRRSRSYGVLYDPEGYRWDNLPEVERYPLLRAVGLSISRAVCRWRSNKETSLDAAERDLLREGLNDRVPLDIDQVQWVGSMRYEHGHGYRVLINLIPEDKSVRDASPSVETSQQMDTGPPLEPGYWDALMADSEFCEF